MTRFALSQRFANGVQCVSDTTVIEARALTPSLWRIRIGEDATLPADESWAVPAERRHAGTTVTIGESAQGLILRSAASHLHIATATGAITIEDIEGRLILADAQDAPVLPGRTGFVLAKRLSPDTRLFGLGDKPGRLDLRQRSFAQWTTDSYAFEAGQDPLYKDIPFFIGYERGRSFGVLLDNSWRKFFDFGVSDPELIRFGALGGPIDYYVMTGPTPAEVVSAYGWLTGLPPLPPKWALGYHHSRYSYQTRKDVRKLARRAREKRVPSDVIWLDLHVLNERRAFTIDETAFPKFRSLVEELHAEKFRIVMIADLHIAHVPDGSYQPYATGLAQDAFVHTEQGALYIDEVWPGPCVFPDFTMTTARVWWGDQVIESVTETGVDGIWNDMNEPAVFNKLGTFRPEVRHRIATEGFAPRVAPHAEIHNIYGMLNAKATREGLLRMAPDRRPFVMMRASYAGGQRYGVTWTGDNVATWEHLRLSTAMLLNLGLSGFAFAGVNLGGFVGNSNPDLLTRWLQVGMFNPIADNHSDLGTAAQEPWVDGKAHLHIRRAAIETRYRLLPYLYTLAEEASRTGLPFMRPLFLEFPEAAGGFALDRQAPTQFMVGAALMVAPPPYGEMPGAFDVLLPPGGWYDFWTGARIGTDRIARITGNSGTTKELDADPRQQCHVIRREPEAGRIAVFARAGAILPSHDVIQSTAETPSGPLRLAIYADTRCSGTLYDDDGETHAFRDGQFLRLLFSAHFAEDDNFTVTISRQEGQYAPWWSEIEVTIHGLETFGTLAVKPGGKIKAGFDADTQSLRFTLPATPEGMTISGTGRRQKSAPPED